ncbi:MAG: radical SAM family heme chaperone HemW [Candidatus Omnitrophota bacterium]
MQVIKGNYPSLYIHIPFCARKCAYCDFYSVVYDKARAEAYVDVVCRQISRIDWPVSTIFIGGGTPTVLETPVLGRLLGSLKKLSRGHREFTVEANPESLTPDKIGLMLDMGVNRLSIGVQSFNDIKLKRLGRLHNAKRARDSVVAAGKKGFRNISADLIFGAPDETLESCERELREAVRLPVKHLSCYCLSYERGTPLFDERKKGIVVPVDEECSAKMYAYAMSYLPKNGFAHYEVSNFAAKGYRCMHNINYWDNNEYMGIGPSAASCIDGVRKRCIPDVDEYMKRISSGGNVFVSPEKLIGERKAKETAALKIRTAGGIGFAWFKRKTGYDLINLEAGVITGLEGSGLIKIVSSKGRRTGIRLTRAGFIHCDTVSSELL